MAVRLALIIANSEFDDPKLTDLAMPSRDAEALAEVLRDPEIGGFQVSELIDKPLPVVRREIARLYQRRTKDDLLLLYYSGHGFKDDYGELYLAVKDTEHEILGATALDAVFVRRQLDQSNSQRKVVVLDCCHSGAFVPGGKAVLGSSVGTGEALAGSGYGRVILTASNAVEYAWEGDKLLGGVEASTFTRFLVQGLRTGAADLDANGHISLDELYEYVYEQVVTSGHSKQTPQKWTQKVEGQITIARNPHAVVKPAELPFDLKRAVESPLAGLREGAVRELDRLLLGSDKALALAAQQALERLLDDDSRRVSVAAARALRAFPKPTIEEPAPAPAPTAVVEPIESEMAKKRRGLRILPSGIPALSRWLVGTGLVILALTGIVFLLTRGDGDDGELVLSPATRTVTAVAAIPVSTDTITARPTGMPTSASTATDSVATELRATLLRPADDMLMVHVPGGTFEMGSTDGDDDEQPVHTVTLDGFWMDKYEVTNTQFAAFLNERGNKTEGGVTWLDLGNEYSLIEEVGGEYRPKSGYDSHPVVLVSWYGASAYCEWVVGRLPTEAQWEYAARGPDETTYPWGDVFDGERLNFCDANCEFEHRDTDWDDGFARTAPVGSFEAGKSWCGAQDMAGNVWEWVSDWYGDYSAAAQTSPTGSNSGDVKVLRSGSWSDDQNVVRSTTRSWDFPGDRYNHYGFRCVNASTSSP